MSIREIREEIGMKKFIANMDREAINKLPRCVKRSLNPRQMWRWNCWRANKQWHNNEWRVFSPVMNRIKGDGWRHEVYTFVPSSPPKGGEDD
jgi:hypothetical protein